MSRADVRHLSDVLATAALLTARGIFASAGALRNLGGLPQWRVLLRRREIER